MWLFKKLFGSKKEIMDDRGITEKKEIMEHQGITEKQEMMDDQGIIEEQENIESQKDVKILPTNVYNNGQIPCGCCSGFYKIREGKYGIFAGCSNYPNCKSTLNISNIILKYIEHYGLNIYCWEKVCYKCQNKTPVYSYYLDYDLGGILDVGFAIGLGDLGYIDKLLSSEIPSIRIRYSKTTNSKYVANTCKHCNALQGRNYVVEDPHEIMSELWGDLGMEKFLFKNIEIKDITPLREDIRKLCSYEF